MSSPEPLDGSTTSSLPQRILIVAGTLVVIVLTIVAAVFLTVQDLPETTPTSIAQASPTAPFLPSPTPALPSPTAGPVQPTATLSVSAAPTSIPTPIPTPPPSATLIPTLEPTPVPPPPTDTPTLAFTPTPQVVVVTATPVPPSPPESQPPAAPLTVCQPPAGWVTYQVQLGDTLNSLSLRTNTSVYELQQVNCLESFTLQIGQVIYLPFTPPTPTVTNTPTPRTPTPTPSRTGTPTATPRPPEIFGIVPDAGLNTGQTIVAIQGRNFLPDQEGFRAELRTGGTKVQLELGELRTTTSFEAIVPAGLPPDIYDLWVINSDDQFDIRSLAYEVLSP